MIGRSSRMISNVVTGSVGAEVSTGPVVSLTSPRPSFRSNLRRFSHGLSWCYSVCCSFVASSTLAGCSSCVVCIMGWEGCGSSHSVFASSANRRFADRGGSVGLLDCGADRPRGGNSIVRYCCIIGLSFLPAWYACMPSHSVGPLITPQSTARPSKVSMMIPAFYFGIPYTTAMYGGM